MMIIKIAAIQMIATERKEDNLKRALRFIRMAGEDGAKLAALPELFSTQWFPHEVNRKHFALAEGVKGLTITEMRNVSRELGMVLSIPFFEKYRRKYYNSCALIDKGKLVGVYRKVHIPDIPYWEERAYFSAGSEFPVFDTSLGKIGIQICWDNFFWEGYRLLALKGARLVITPTASAYSTQKRWRVVITTHAVLNNIYILRVNRIGKEKVQEFYGGSFLVGPDGVMKSEPAARTEGIYFANMDLAEVGKVRKLFPFMRERRPDLYSAITAKVKD